MRLLLFLVAFSVFADATEPTAPLMGAHAHNDYEHERPLLDALSHGFQSVEADIYLVDGALLVAHDRDKVSPERTLQSLYLEPLKKRIAGHANKRVYAGSNAPLYLLIDLKSEGASTYRALHQVLTEYREILTEFPQPGQPLLEGAVTVIVSGNRPRDLLATMQPRLAAFDGRLSDLESADPIFVPWISDRWGSHFTWRGEGPLPKADQEKLESILTKAHQRKLQVRFWAIPDAVASWEIMHAHGVDFINTDKLADLCDFLTEKQASAH